MIAALLGNAAEGCGASGAHDGNSWGPGSYNVTMHDVVPDNSGSEELAAGFEGSTLRVDLGSELPFAGNTVYRTTVIVTAKYGDPALFHADWGQGSIVLSSPRPGFASNGPEDTGSWHSLSVAPDPAHAAPAVVTQAELVQSVSCGDCMYSVPFHAVGSVTLDGAPPQARLDAVSALGPADALLPWDDVKIRFSEPVTFENPDSSLTFRQETGDLPTYSYETPDVMSLEGASGFVGVVGEPMVWPAQGRSSVDLDLGATLDLNGNRMPPQHWSVPLLDLKNPVDAGSLLASGPPSWGAVAFTTTDALCSGSRCAEVGPFNVLTCTAERLGFAGSVTPPPGTTTLEIRYRVLSYADLTPQQYFVSPFRIQTATPNSKDVNPAPSPVAADFAPLTTAALGATAATGLQTFSVPVVPSPGKPLAIALYAGPGDNQICYEPQTVPSYKMAVLVDSIAFR